MSRWQSERERSRTARHGACHHWATSAPAIPGLNHACCTVEQAPRRAGAVVAEALLLPLKDWGTNRSNTGYARVAGPGYASQQQAQSACS